MIAPKTGAPSVKSATDSGMYEVSVYFPAGSSWYYWRTMEPITASMTETIYVGDSDYPIFVKAGSIVPILDFSYGRMSLLEAQQDSVRLEIYPLATSATGQLYLDDGQSFAYETGAYCLMEYTFTATEDSFTVTGQMNAGNGCSQGSTKLIDEIAIAN